MSRARWWILIVVLCAVAAYAAGPRVPERVTAGQDVTFAADNGAMVYVSGPGYAAKLKAQGGNVVIKGSDLATAGRYLVSIDGQTNTMWVVAGPVKEIAFLAQPSRVPAARRGAISGTAYLLDAYNNLVPAPTAVKFDLSVDGNGISRSATSHDGVAWVQLDAGRKEGAAQFIASANGVSEKRIVRQVAAEPCNLRMTARPDSRGILVETAPVRDCSGNAVPDGTIVTFTQHDAKGKTTVDARVKKGTAQALLPPASSATISVASGVAIGNEIRWGGGR